MDTNYWKGRSGCSHQESKAYSPVQWHKPTRICDVANAGLFGFSIYIPVSFFVFCSSLPHLCPFIHHPPFSLHPSSKYHILKMKFFTTVCLLTLAGFGLTSPVEQSEQATCATCRQGCLQVDTGDCFPQWPRVICDLYSGVRHSSPSLITAVLMVVTARV